MAKGIIRVVNTYNNTEVGYIASEDVDETMLSFENGVMPTRGLARYPHKESLKLEVAEVTDDLAMRYAFYAWPNLERVKYSEECMSLSREKGFSNKVKKSVDWLIGMYPDTKYSFELTMEDTTLVAIIYESGRRSEKYTFEKRSGEPSTRQYIG